MLRTAWRRCSVLAIQTFIYLKTAFFGVNDAVDVVVFPCNSYSWLASFTQAFVEESDL